MRILNLEWWKWLGALFLLYAVSIALLVKTGPGVARTNVVQKIADRGVELQIEGYNTHFDVGETKVWLKVKEELFCASAVRSPSANELIARFDPFNWSGTDSTGATVVVENEVDGMFLDVQGARLVQDSATVRNVCNSRPEKLSPAYFSFPYRSILYETIRNLNFHVPMWFAMIILLLCAFICSILYLNRNAMRYDRMALAFSSVGILFGILGITTGSFWAHFTWGAFWTSDPKLNGAAIGLLIYLAYMVLRSALEDPDKRARISAVYNILAYPMFIVLIIVLPKLADFSLHPGSGDSVGFNTYDLDNNLRKVFYPAVIGWILIGVWIAQLKYRQFELTDKENEL